MKSLSTAFAFLLATLLGSCTPHVNLNTPLGTRPPNSHELFYTDIAARFGDARFCDKISRRAIDESGPDLGSTQWRVYGQRSACYFYVALQTKNEKFCDSVSSTITLPSNASEISAAKCRLFVHLPNQQPTAQYGVFPEFLKEMRYTDEDRYAAEYLANLNNSSIVRFYGTIANSESFKLKVRSLPSYDEPYSLEKLRPDNGDEILTTWLAGGDAIPKLCGKISPNSYDEGPRSLRWNAPQKMALRNSCFFDVAQRTHKSSLCRQIVPLDATVMRTTSQKDCEAQLKIQARDKNPAFRYGAFFSMMKPFAEELRKLGYAEPFLIDERTMDWSHFYLFMLYDAPQETKMELLKKAENLPSFKD